MRKHVVRQTFAVQLTTKDNWSHLALLFLKGLQAQVDSQLSSCLWYYKMEMAKRATLTYPDFTKPFQVYTDLLTGLWNFTRHSTTGILYIKTLWCSNKIHSYWTRTSSNCGDTSITPLFFPHGTSNKHLLRIPKFQQQTMSVIKGSLLLCTAS